MNIRKPTHLTICATLITAFAVGCSGGDDPIDGGTPRDGGTNTPTDATPLTLATISLTPSDVTLEVGATQALAVTGTYSDGSTETLTSGVTFETSDDTVALVDTAGVVTAVAEGPATITATAEGLDAAATITVTDDPVPTGFAVFADDFAAGVTFEDFGGATNVISVDDTEMQEGAASLKIEVPADGYTGGAMKIDTAQDLSGYDALTFWAKASAAHSLNVVGIGNDAASTTFQAEVANVAVTETWTKFIVPLPLASKLTAEQGLFHFAEGADEGAYTLWLDDVRYETLGAGMVSNPRPAIATESVTLAIAAVGQVNGASVTFSAGGSDVLVTPTLAYFTLASSNEAVATVDAAGVVTAIGEGSADITAKLGTVDAAGALTVTVSVGAPSLLVFGDDYGTGISFQEFGGSTNAVSIDTAEMMAGAASLRIEVPAGGYTGGAMKLDAPTNLSAYDAITFWAKSSVDNPFNVFGLGNNGTDSVYNAEWNAVALTGTWTKFVIPIPNAARLTAEDGLFHFAEGSEHGAYTIWLDDIQYEVLGSATIANPRPAIATETVNIAIGDAFTVNGTSVVYAVDGTDQVIAAARPYFDFASGDINIATVNADGTGVAVATGSTDITATLGAVDAAGALTVQVSAPTLPTVAAPTPTLPMGNVISLYSDAYTDGAVDTWSAPWDQADLADVMVAGNATKLYTNLNFAGIEFVGPNSINASSMTHFHLDIWTPNSTVFRVKLVDFGADNGFGGGDDTEHEITFDAASTPALMTGAWQSFDIPFTDFVNLTNRSNLSQLILVGSTSTVYVDNIYFHN